MSGGTLLILIVVLWLVVLAPLWLRGQRPIRKAGRALEETRVVYEGGSSLPAGVRRPRVSAADVRPAAPDDDEDYEVVDAEDDVLVDDRAEDEETEEAASSAAAADPAVVEGSVVHELEPARAGDATAISPEDLEEADAGGAFDLPETFTSPEDLLYPDTPARGNGMRVVAGTDVVDESEREETTPADEEPRADEEPAAGDELTAEELEFAASRRGRGGWDPQADREHSVTRYQRRQRTLLALVGVDLVAVVCGFVFGGWAWLAAAAAVALTAGYLFALRSQVRQEEALRARRIRQLRRARLGVRNRDDEALAIPRALRRPGAVVVELDDESPDFTDLELIDAPFGDDDTFAGGPAPRRAVG